MVVSEQDVVTRLRSLPALLVVLAVLCAGGAVASLVDAVSDVRGQQASDAGELVARTKYLVRTDSYHEFSETEFRLTEHGVTVPGQIEVGDVPRSSRLHGTGEVTAYYYAGDLVAIRLDDGMTITSTLFGFRGAVASFLLAGGLLLAAAYAVLVLRRRAPAPLGRATSMVLVATGLSWVAVVSALPVVVSVVLLEGAGIWVARRVWRS